MKFIKYNALYFLFIGLFLFGGVFVVFAESFPTFKTLPVEETTTTTAILRGDFNSHGVSEFPTLFFQYGTKPDSLNHVSVDTVAVSGHYVVSQIVDALNPNTIYFYRTVLKLDHSLIYGDTSSFRTKKAAHSKGASTSQNTLNLQQMLGDYDSYATYSTESHNTSTFQNNVAKEEEDDGSFSFFDLFSWGKKKKTHTSTPTNNLVHQQKLNDISSTQSTEERNDNSNSLQSSDTHRVHNNKSASENDEWGEVVYYNTNYQNNYKKNNSPVKNSSGLNYTKLFFFLVILLVFLIIARMIYLNIKRRRHFSHIKKSVIHPEESKYFIPVDESLVQQNNGVQVQKPGVSQGKTQAQAKNNTQTTFFRRPPRKK